MPERSSGSGSFRDWIWPHGLSLVGRQQKVGAAAAVAAGAARHDVSRAPRPRCRHGADATVPLVLCTSRDPGATDDLPHDDGVAESGVPGRALARRFAGVDHGPVFDPGTCSASARDNDALSTACPPDPGGTQGWSDHRKAFIAWP